MQDQSERYRLLRLAIPFEGGLAVLAWGLGWLLGQPVWQTIHWDVAGVAVGVAASLPLLLLFCVCVSWPVGPLARINRFSEEIIRPLFAPCSLLDLAVVSLLAGLGEEMLFRGVLHGLFSRWFGPWTGLAAASVVFGVVHPITVTYAILATLMGAFLGWLYIVTGNLLVAIVAHGLYDFVALVFLVKGPVENPNASGPAGAEEVSEERPAEETAG